MPGTLKDHVWDMLLERVEDGCITPFLGAGACYGAIETGGQIARAWSKEYSFPLGNSDNLIEVAQYLAVKYDAPYPKRLLLEQHIRGATLPGGDDEPHRVLAGLPLPVYVTTNYDDLMVQALREHPFRDPIRGECRWNLETKQVASDLPPEFEPSAATPLVFHLHGYSDPNYLVLTEDDYLRFLASMARNPDFLPKQVIKALGMSSCIFIGYRLADWNFRLLFENLREAFKYKSVAVLLPPGDTNEQRSKASDYLEQYYKNALDLEDIYWGTARDFCAELRDRRKARSGKREPLGYDE